MLIVSEIMHMPIHLGDVQSVYDGVGWDIG